MIQRSKRAGKRWSFWVAYGTMLKKSSVLGYKVLVAVYWDGKQSIPVDFSMHNEKGQNKSRPYGMSKKDNRKQYSKKRVKESEGSKRIKELDISMIEMMLRMLYLTIYRCISIDYVLVDS